MGRPYASEIQEFDATYEWAVAAPISELARSIAQAVHHPLIAVGSGGSLTSAHFATLLHTRLAGQASQTTTPYDLVTNAQQIGGSAVLICSAGGSNPDVVTAAELLIRRVPRQLIAITTKSGSPLQTQLESALWPQCHAFTTPTKKDGFLATNSLLATIVLLIRAYETWTGADTCLPRSLDVLLHPGATRRNFVDQFREHVAPVVERSTLIVLHGATTKPAAMDVESRFTEAALANVQPADYRNFAHGRHHWLARHAATSAVLAFTEEGDEIARRTLALLPASIPRWLVSVEPGLRGAVSAVCHSLFLANFAGAAKGIDPGRPHVPTFGRKLYHLKAMPRLHSRADNAQERMNLAIERKTGRPLSSLAVQGQLDGWSTHYRAFVERLSNARIRGLVIDYDGTLCAPHRRLDGPSSDVLKRLNALLNAGVIVAIATGRGKSVREALHKHVTSAANRARLIVGYHNGAEIAPLGDKACPPSERPLVPELATIAKALQESNTILRHATVGAKGKQISLELLSSGDATVLLNEAIRLVARYGACGTSLVNSSHSVDVIAPGVSKENVVEHLAKLLRITDGGATSILCIGDRGRPPGNDADLLRHPLSLSVDEVSEDPSTCWCIAEPGLRFDLACLDYLTRLRPGKSGMRFDVKGVQI
jgi:fructoselysine-6-P-deglycase FrlB-like protein/hydroxymethylpyrimidine pyrophosphatase-like HAD family hydrolase